MRPLTLKSLMASMALVFCFSSVAMADVQAEGNITALAGKLHAQDAATIAESLVSMVDIDRTAKFVLGRHVREISPKDLSDFTGRFERFLTGFVESRADEIADGEIRIVTSYDRSDHDCVVTTRVSSTTREPTTMRWRLIKAGGDWHIVDVEMHGVWLAIEQRAQIDSLLRKRGDISDIYADQTS
ncbi:MlaC/ttg2D family ABC transporter substrate-binding protein [Hyphomonas adhaerens]|uniref:MlaC/ttg2D family ABC transporter substrate-binding protein n=1 Tax=Hyphomonas adhaerens TaxID=81029 RepID=UPI002353A268|nr:ABC transporter substrate-binding protein [Hyphomonas adhaerens]